MSTPHTIAESYLILKQRKDAILKPSAIEVVVDILGFVKNVSISQPSAALAPSAQKAGAAVSKCTLWLVDESCTLTENDNSSSTSSDPCIQMAQFCLYGTGEVARVQQEQIQVGDLIRINGVSLKEGPFSSPSSPCFHFSAACPEPGTRWVRLGSFHSSTEFDLIPESSTRHSTVGMLTCPERIKALTDWFVNTQAQGSLQLLPQSTSAMQLPCRKRCLQELQTSVGIRSNIQVRVTNIFSQPARMVTSTVRTRNKTNKKQKYQHPVPQLVVATVTDDSGIIMSLVDAEGRFQALLDEAMANRSTKGLVVTNVLTKSASKLGGVKLACATNETVLLATSESNAFLVSALPIEHSPMIDTDETQTQVFGSTDFYQQHGKKETFASEIMDLEVDGVSFRRNPKQIFSSVAAFQKRILLVGDGRASGGLSYRTTAKVHFHTKSGYRNPVEVAPSVLQCLCGGLDPSDLVSDKSLCQHSMDFVRALIHDKVQLKWTINWEHPVPIVTKVVLHKLPN
jgi:hypothetical protein